MRLSNRQLATQVTEQIGEQPTLRRKGANKMTEEKEQGVNRKSPKKRHYTQVNFRLTEAEKERWQKQASSLNMTLPKFSKHLINLFFDSGTIKQPKIDKQQGTEIARHLAKLGGNVNQIAKWCNTHQHDISDVQAKRLAENLAHVQKELKQVWQQLN